METESIETDRLLLLKRTEGIYKAIFGHHTDMEAMEQLGLDTLEELRIEKQKIAQGVTTFNKSFLIFHLYLKTSRSVIGRCGFHTWYIDHKRAEIGYALTNPHEQGKGIMTEAIAPVIAYGFEKMGLNRIEAFIGPDNIPSLQLIRKMGFTQEGVMREHYQKNNQIEDSIIFSLLRREYNQQK